MVSLSNGLWAKVDHSDVDRVMQYRWSASGAPPRSYIRGRVGDKTALLHRFILGAPKGFDVDHANGDVFDNRRSNLRLCSRGQNNANSLGLPSRRKGKYRGVYWVPDMKKWEARIKVSGKQKVLGYFSKEDEAAAAYDGAAKLAWGEFARPNLAVFA